jgi:hypothetical protein
VQKSGNKNHGKMRVKCANNESIDAWKKARVKRVKGKNKGCKRRHG